VPIQDEISPEIFALYPGYCWGKVLCSGLDNDRAGEAVAKLLRQAEDRIRDDPELAEIAAHPRIASWRDAFSAFGARPSKFQSSVEALVRRARRGDTLPLVNPLVGLYNAVSLQHLVPVGGDDLDQVAGGLRLLRARGDEPYHELGTGQFDPPAQGEVIYADRAKVLCRRWCWRQGDETKITPRSRSVVLNIHGLPPARSADVEAAARELADLVPRLFGGRATWYLLDREHPEARTELPLS
jgi:DNA/RNA-binding domain of Phe-tRNA-synthetase-like protein